MTPADLIRQASADGVQIRLAPSGERIRLIGDQTAVDRWLAIVSPPAYREALVADLQVGSWGGIVQ